MQLLKNLVLHDLQQRDMLSKLERKRAEIWHAGTFDGAVAKQDLLAAYLNQIEFGGRESPPERRVAQAKPPALSLPSPSTRHFIPQAYPEPDEDALWPEDAEESLGRW